jgi:hypothetical protein
MVFYLLSQWVRTTVTLSVMFEFILPFTAYGTAYDGGRQDAREREAKKIGSKSISR